MKFFKGGINFLRKLMNYLLIVLLLSSIVPPSVLAEQRLDENREQLLHEEVTLLTNEQDGFITIFKDEAGETVAHKLSNGSVVTRQLNNLSDEDQVKNVLIFYVINDENFEGYVAIDNIVNKDNSKDRVNIQQKVSLLTTVMI